MNKTECKNIIDQLNTLSKDELHYRARKLDQREKDLLLHLYLYQDMTMAQYAACESLSNERIHQIRDRALQKLSKPAFPINGDEIDCLCLSTRTENALKRHGIYKISEAVNATPADLLKIRNFGAKCYEELITALQARGLGLKEAENDK